MTHREALLHELREHGRTTYAELLRVYGKRGYTYRGFQVAVVQAIAGHSAASMTRHYVDHADLDAMRKAVGT